MGLSESNTTLVTQPWSNFRQSYAYFRIIEQLYSVISEATCAHACERKINKHFGRYKSCKKNGVFILCRVDGVIVATVKRLHCFL